MAPATSDANSTATPATDASASAALVALKQREQELRDQLASQSAESQGNGETVVSNQTDGAAADPTQDSQNQDAQTTDPQAPDSQTQAPDPAPSTDPAPTTDPAQGPVVVKPHPRPPVPHTNTGASGGYPSQGGSNGGQGSNGDGQGGNDDGNGSANSSGTDDGGQGEGRVEDDNWSGNDDKPRADQPAHSGQQAPQPPSGGEDNSDD